MKNDQQVTVSNNTAVGQSEKKRFVVGPGLKAHIGAFVIVNAFLAVAWKLSDVSYPWFLWVLAGWGVGLAFHILGLSLAHAAKS
jgi:2TM domain